MAITTNGSSSNYLRRAPGPSGLADILAVILGRKEFVTDTLSAGTRLGRLEAWGALR